MISINLVEYFKIQQNANTTTNSSTIILVHFSIAHERKIVWHPAFVLFRMQIKFISVILYKFWNELIPKWKDAMRLAVTILQINKFSYNRKLSNEVLFEDHQFMKNSARHICSLCSVQCACVQTRVWVRLCMLVCENHIKSTRFDSHWCNNS